MIFFYLFLYDFQDTKKSLKIPQGVSRIRKSMKDRQHKEQTTIYKIYT
jgi:hypothetical protein